MADEAAPKTRAEVFAKLTGRPLSSSLTLGDLSHIEKLDVPAEPEPDPAAAERAAKIADLEAQLAEAKK